MVRISDGTHGQYEAGLWKGEDVVVEEGKEREGTGCCAQDESLVYQGEVFHVAVLLLHYLMCGCVCMWILPR